MFACLLLLLCIHVCLSRSRIYHALYPLGVCACRTLRLLACVVASVPPRACLDVTNCEIHICGIGMLDSHLSLLHVMFIYLLCLLSATCLTFFTSLHLCTLANMFMHESVCHPYFNPMEIWTLNPNLHLSS